MDSRNRSQTDHRCFFDKYATRERGDRERRILRDQTGRLRVNSGNQSVSASPLKGDMLRFDINVCKVS